MARKTGKILLASLPIALTACGGGGSDGGGADIQLPSSAAAITAQSAPTVAAAVVETLVGSENLTGIGVLAAPSAGLASGAASSLSDAPPALAATLGPEIIDCAAGGTLTISGEIANAQSLSAGDAIAFAFVDCNDGDGTLVDGEVSFTIISVSGSPSNGMFRMTMSMTLTDLQFIENGVGGAMDGEISFTVDTTNAPVSSLSVSSNAFGVSVGDEIATLTNYIVTITIDPNLGTATLDSSASLTSTQFAGQVSYRTTESLVFGANGAPTAGEVLIEGANGATLTISVVSANQVDLELDVDGNGTIDEVMTTTWEQLAG